MSETVEKPDAVSSDAGGEDDFAEALADRVRRAAQTLPAETPMAVLYRIDPPTDQE